MQALAAVLGSMAGAPPVQHVQRKGWTCSAQDRAQRNVGVSTPSRGARSRCREKGSVSNMSKLIELIDTPYSIVGRVLALKRAGVVGAIRYISPDTANFPSKRLKLAEVQAAAQNSFWLGTVWEVMGNAAEMTAATAKIHADLAIHAAQAVRQPTGSAIAFAVDYDAPESDFEKIEAYFTEVHQACKNDGYLTTGYGSEAVIKFLLGKGLIHFQWLAGAPGWSDSRFAKGEDINQTNAGNVTVAGLPVDLDVLTGAQALDPTKAGLWLPKL